MAKKNVGYLNDVLKVMEASRKVMIIREGFTGVGPDDDLTKDVWVELQKE